MSKVSDSDYFGDREQVSEIVENNALDFEKLINPDLWENDEDAVTYATPWGSVVLDFYIPDNGLVSVEIGDTKVGYFTDFENGINYGSDGFIWNDHTKVENEMLEWFLRGKNKAVEDQKRFLKQRAVFCGMPNIWVLYKDSTYLVAGYEFGRLILAECSEVVTWEDVQVILREESGLTDDEKLEYRLRASSDELEDWLNYHCVDHRDMISRGWAVNAESLGDSNPYKYGILCSGKWT